MPFCGLCLFTIVTLFTHSVAAADTIQQCVAKVCERTSPEINTRDFLDLEKAKHPDLEEFYGRYRARLEQVRLAREKQVRDSLKFFEGTNELTASIRNLPDQELMSLLVAWSPWNYGTGRLNGQYTVVVEPLTANLHQREVIKQIALRLQSASALFAAQLKVNQLNASPHSALQISDSEDIQNVVLKTIQARIRELSNPAQLEYTQKLNQYLLLLETFKKQHGEKAYIWLGSMELELQVKLGRIPFVNGERSVVEQILIDGIPGVIEHRKEGIAKIDEIYSLQNWEKSCRSAFNRALHYGLTKNERDRVELQIKPEAIRRSQETLRGLFGDAITSEIMSYVRTMNIGGPMSLNDYIQDLEFNMQKALEHANKTELPLIERYELVNGLGNLRDYRMASLCNAWIFEPLRDSVSGRNVILSVYSAKNYAVGLWISLHEIAHAASIALDLLKRHGEAIVPFESVRECISKNYEFVARKPVYDHSQFRADKLWTEEDWADAFAGYAMRDLKVNPFCGFLGAKPEYDFVTLPQRSGDPHSPTFYRILNNHAHAGNSQVNQCREPLQTQFQGVNFKDCISPFIKHGSEK